MGEHRIVRVVVSGGVQGVGFRAWTRHQAELRGLAGWVRNRRDGTVEAVLSGPGDVVEGMLEVLRQGPSNADVNGVDIEDGDRSMMAGAGPGRFEILATV